MDLLEVGGNGDQGNLQLGREEIPDHVAAHVKFELAIQQQQRPVGLRAARNDGDVESISGVSAVGRRLKEAARRRICQPIGAEFHSVERERRPSEAEQSHQGSKHRQSHFDAPRPYGLLRREGSEIKSRSRRSRFLPSVARRVASRIPGRVLPAHVRSVYMAAAKVSMLFAKSYRVGRQELSRRQTIVHLVHAGARRTDGLLRVPRNEADAKGSARSLLRVASPPIPPETRPCRASSIDRGR